MEKTRSQNAKRNILFGYIAQVGICILSFIGRKIFLGFLAVDYLGINGLYTNILTVMSLAELGVDTAVVYSLYKPVADHDTKLIHSMIVFFRRIYWGLSLLILVLGLLLIPFLQYLIKSDIPHDDLVFFYVLFLINTVASYFVAERVALLSAFQEQRVQKLVTLAFNLVLQITYIAVLIIYRNYYAYVIAIVINTIMTTIALGIIAGRLHPDIFREKELVPFDKKPVIDRIKDTLLYKIGAVLINSTDNILISVLVSTAAVGLYANYVTVVSAITAFIAIITTSLIAGIGNLGVKEGKEKQKDLFFMMVFAYHFVAALGLIGFSLLFNDLIALWVGEEFQFDFKTVVIIAVNFYLPNAVSPVWMFREANGLFDDVKYLLLIRAALNLVFSVAFGMVWGVFGILLATTVSMILTNFWFEPSLIFKKLFASGAGAYWRVQLKYLLITAVSFTVSMFAIKPLGDSLLMTGLKGGLIVIITTAFFVVTCFKTDEYKKLKGYLVRRR